MHAINGHARDIVNTNHNLPSASCAMSLPPDLKPCKPQVFKVRKRIPRNLHNRFAISDAIMCVETFAHKSLQPLPFPGAGIH